jgi:hypothetical protein
VSADPRPLVMVNITGGVTCEVCGNPSDRCRFGHPSGPCSCWRQEPCRPVRRLVHWVAHSIAGLQIDPVPFTAPADATSAELEAAAVAAMLAR